MDYLAVWGTEQFQFGIFMMCFGIVIGAMCAYGAIRIKAQRARRGVPAFVFEKDFNK